MRYSSSALTCLVGCLIFGAPLGAAAPPTKQPGWIVDAGNASIPNVNAMGKINGVPFSVDRSQLLAHELTLYQGKDIFGKHAFSISLSTFDYPEIPEGQTIVIHDRSDDFPAPPMVSMEWRQPQATFPDSKWVNHYTMCLKFGKRRGDHLPGLIYLCVKDQQKSFIVGHFNAAVTARAALRQVDLPPAPEP